MRSLVVVPLLGKMVRGVVHKARSTGTLLTTTRTNNNAQQHGQLPQRQRRRGGLWLSNTDTQRAAYDQIQAGEHGPFSHQLIASAAAYAAMKQYEQAAENQG